MTTRLLAVLILLMAVLSGCTFGLNPDVKEEPGRGFQEKSRTGSEGGGGGGY